MEWMREVPEPLSMAQMSLETVEGLTLLQTFRWIEQEQKWIIRFRISLPELDTDCSLSASDWYLTADESYPLGDIDIYPAKENGITDTYPHQSYNSEGDPNVPWRTGKICTNTQAKIIGRHGYDVEPYMGEERLLWHCKRTIEWIRCASKGELILPGEPFELPLIPPSHKHSDTFIFSEGALDILPWSNSHPLFGRARCFNLRTKENKWFLDMLMGLKNEDLHHVSWGQYVTRFREKTWDGIWLRIPEVPAVKPYRFPETWSELRQKLSELGVSIREVLNSTLRYLRDGKIHFLLIGFPIPANWKGLNASMHWIAIALPVLSRNKQYLKGFRPNEKGYFENDMQTIFKGNEKIVYIPTENWHHDQIQNRGRFREGLRASRIAVIGCGALGAPIAEMLVRGGVNKITLFDDDSVEIGNLTRHTLALNDIGESKAAQLAQRLNSLNPNADVAYNISKVAFTNTDTSNRLLDHDIILDCTGNDDLLHVIASIKFPHLVHFFSLSIGFRAKRMFFFHAIKVSFPIDYYLMEMSAWLELEQDEFKGEAFPRENLGCYHPVFPARCDDMWLWGSVAVKAISRGIDAPQPSEPILHVYEQNEEEDGLVSIHRVIEVPEHE